MGKKDLPMKRYLDDNLVFADYYNQLFKDTPVRINPEELQHVESRLIVSYTADRAKTTPQHRQKHRFSRKGLLVTLERDAYRICVFGKYGNRMCMLGIEAQAVIDRSMPIRVLDYDASSLRLLMQDIATKRVLKQGHDKSFISGLKNGEQLPPVITAVFALEGTREDWPTDLHALLNFPHPSLADYTPNARLFVLTVADLASRPLNEFQSDLGIVSRLLYYANDPEYLKELLSDEENMRKLTPNGMDVLYELVGLDIETHQPKEIPAMTIKEKFAQLIDTGYQKGKAEGKAEGIAEGKAEGIAEGKAEGIAEGKAEEKAKTQEEDIQNFITILMNLGISEEEIIRHILTYYPMQEKQIWLKIHSVLHK